MVLAWEKHQWGFCDVSCCSSFIAVFAMLVVVLHSMLLDVIPHPSMSYCRVFTPILPIQPSSSQSICDTFILTSPGSSFTVLRRALRFWVGIFHLQAFFTLRSFPTFLPQLAFIKTSLGANSSFLKFAGLPLCRQLILYRFLGCLSIHSHQFECRQKAKANEAYQPPLFHWPDEKGDLCFHGKEILSTWFSSQ